MTLISVNGSTSGRVRRDTTTFIATRRPCRAPVRSATDRVNIAWRHSRPLVRNSTVAACATSVALAISVGSSAVVTAATATVGVLLVAAALVDVYEQRLPNRLLTTALFVVIIGAALSTGAGVVLVALLGMTIAGGLMMLVRFTRGVGMGDVKMAAVVGASATAGTGSLIAAPVAIAIAALAAATYGLVSGRSRTALGPSLWVGWATALVLADAFTSSGWLS